MTKSEAGKLGGSKSSDRKRRAAAKNLLTARLVQARKILGLNPANTQPPLLLAIRKDAQ